MISRRRPAEGGGTDAIAPVIRSCARIKRSIGESIRVVSPSAKSGSMPEIRHVDSHPTRTLIAYRVMAYHTSGS